MTLRIEVTSPAASHSVATALAAESAARVATPASIEGDAALARESALDGAARDGAARVRGDGESGLLLGALDDNPFGPGAATADGSNGLTRIGRTIVATTVLAAKAVAGLTTRVIEFASGTSSASRPDPEPATGLAAILGRFEPGAPIFDWIERGGMLQAIDRAGNVHASTRIDAGELLDPDAAGVGLALVGAQLIEAMSQGDADAFRRGLDLPAILAGVASPAELPSARLAEPADADWLARRLAMIGNPADTPSLLPRLLDDALDRLNYAPIVTETIRRLGPWLGRGEMILRIVRDGRFNFAIRQVVSIAELDPGATPPKT